MPFVSLWLPWKTHLLLQEMSPLKLYAFTVVLKVLRVINLRKPAAIYHSAENGKNEGIDLVLFQKQKG